WKSSRVCTWGSTTRTTSPPVPPFPPSGPPSGLNFSRCTDVQPCPPSPAARWRTTRSTNLDMVWAPPAGRDVVRARDAVRCCAVTAQMLSGAGREVMQTPPGPRGRPALRSWAATGSGLGAGRNDVDGLAATLGAELDRTGGEGEQRVVAATPHADARVEPGAALADQDLAGVDLLATEPLDAETLGVGIATVTGADRALLTCHVRVPPSGMTPAGAELVAVEAGSGLLDAGDLDDRQRLTVALPLVVAGLVLELVDPDLGPLGLVDDPAGDRDLGQGVGFEGDGRAVHHEDRGQRHRGAGLALDLLDLDKVPFGDLVLLAAGLDDRVHGGLPLASRVCGHLW